VGIINRRSASMTSESRAERLDGERLGRRRRRRTRAAFAVVVLTGSLVAIAAHGAPPIVHGIAFAKGCTPTSVVGGPDSCFYTITNNVDTAQDTLTISSIVDQVLTSPPFTSANFLSSASLENVGSSATCSGGSGSGTVAAPYVGSTLCTLPPGSQLFIQPFSVYTVVASDFNLFPSHALPDTATLTWNDLCNSGDGTCVLTPQTATAGAQTIVTKLPTTTTTKIHNAVHQDVTTVRVGSTVHDSVSVAGQPGQPVPTGNVNVDWFLNGDCSGAPAANSGSVGPLVIGALDATFDATAFAFTVNTTGKRAFKAHYEGDGLYQGSDGLCEPLTVVDAKISIAADKTNRVGDPHTFTVTLAKDVGDGNGFVVAPGEHVDVVLTDSLGSTHSVPTGTCTGAGPNTDASGQCEITFTSSSTGKVLAHATSTLSVAGSTAFTVGTNPDAVKTFVNARIAIASSATNRVGQPHTFTVTLEKDIGDGNGFVAAPSEHVDVDLNDLLGAVHTAPTGSCTGAGPNTDASGKCTITFTSNTTGTVTGHGRSTLTVGGVPITVETDGTAPNSANAVKTFVNAKIEIAPNATNEVGQSHTFTVTLSKDVGANLGFVPAPGEHVAFTLTDSNGATHSVPTGTCTGAGGNTDASGQCTIIFTSSTAGQVTGHASSLLSVAGSAAFTVETDGTSPNSGNAVKTFVDANISITPLTATNPVSTDHTLTGHVNVNAGLGAGFVNAPDGTTINFVILAGSVGSFNGPSTCNTAGGTGSCTVKITSTVPGTTTVQASTTLNVGTPPVSLTRTTGDGLHSDGANAVKLWADDQIVTHVRDANGKDITGTPVPSGTVVHDEATVTKLAPTPASVPDPTGTVDFTLYHSKDCTGTVVATDLAKPLNGGVATSVTFTAPATAGDYSYLAHYNGVAGVYPAHDALCEPFSVTTPFTNNLTPGYWKNHEFGKNGQPGTQPLLDKAPGIFLGTFQVKTFKDAKTILSGMGCGSVGPINCMAGMLLAAELNLANGGSTCIVTNGVIAQANALLVLVGYNGFDTNYTHAHDAEAKTLHDLLSAYNIDGVPTC
jgi:hypothetical protein